MRRLLVVSLFGMMALVLTGCFQSASESSEPTIVNLTSIATLSTPTPFVTPLSTGGFVPLATETISMFPPTATLDSAAIPPTDVPASPQSEPTTDQSQGAALPPTAVPPPTDVQPPALATPTALPTEGPCIHTVQPGEWLYSIARKYGINPADLLAANPNLQGNPDNLSPGEVLNIPNCNKPQGEPTNAPPQPGAAESAPTATVNAPPAGGDSSFPTPIPVTDRTYTVVKGDTLGSIARKFGITVQQLKDANGIADGDFIRIGQILKIPNAVN